MILLESFTVLPFAFSVLAFSLSVVCVLFYYYMYRKFSDIKYLLRLFLISAISTYFLFEILYFVFFINNSATKTHIYFYILKEIFFIYIILILFIAMKEITYKNFLSDNILNYMINILLVTFFFISISAVVNPSHFIKLTNSYLNIYQNRVNIYGIGDLFLIKDVLIGFILVFNIVVLTYIIIFLNARLKYNIITLLSITILLVGFVDDCYGLYFFYHKTNSSFYMSRISIGLGFFLIGLLITSILRILDNLKKIEKEKDILEERVLIENQFIDGTRVILNEAIEYKNILCNMSMLLINISRSSKDYISLLRKQLELSYEQSINFTQLEYDKQSESIYSEYTFNKLSKSFLEFNKSIDKTKGSIQKITDIIILLMSKTSSISSESNLILSNIENYSLVSREKSEVIAAHFKKNSSLNQLPVQIRRVLSTMKNMSERITTLSVNSSIQSSKSGEYSEGFSIISKEIALLVDDTNNASNKLDDILNSVNKIFKDFSSAKNSISDNISVLSNYVGSLNLNIRRIPEFVSVENDNNTNIIDNNKALDTLIGNIVFLLKDEIENTNSMKEDIKSIIESFSKIDSEFSLYKKKIHSSMYDINKIDNISNELGILSLEFDKIMRNISELLDNLF